MSKVGPTNRLECCLTAFVTDVIARPQPSFVPTRVMEPSNMVFGLSKAALSGHLRGDVFY